MVYVLHKNGHPLMPTKNHAKVRILLKQNKAKIVNRCPFTIQLAYESTDYTQPVTLGIDAGSKKVGVSASTNTKELYSSEVTLRNDISDLLSARRELRRSRRNRKTRYRKARFLNCVHSKHKGWLAPSIEQKIQTHLTIIKKVVQLVPVSEIVVETASFDTQLLKAQLNGEPLPEGTDYQQGSLYDWNLREYVFHRDNYTCQWCKGKSGDKILVTHHHAYWKGDHTNKADSLITLCSTCNDSKYHKKEATRLWGWEPFITHSFKDASFMTTMRWALYNKIKEIYEPLGISVRNTYGYITKNTRIEAGLPKEHRVDALCIAGHPKVVPVDEWYMQKKVRCHNRQLHKCTIGKGGVRKANQAPKYVKGYQLFDKVRYGSTECFIFGRRSSGYFDIRLLDGTVIHRGISYKKLKLLETSKTYLTERICTCSA